MNRFGLLSKTILTISVKKGVLYYVEEFVKLGDYNPLLTFSKKTLSRKIKIEIGRVNDSHNSRYLF